LRVIIGLGNPGDRYARTRHNVGARVLERASARWSIPLQPSASARLGTGRIGPPGNPVEVALAIPHAWMNQSGTAVAELLARLGGIPQDLVVIHDDLDMEPGRLRIKREGGAGGHNGLLSILTELSTDQFSRLKIGIGRPAPGVDPADYVLEPFTQDETTVIEASVDRAVLALECLVVEGPDAAMNKFHVKGPEAQE
jgi:PTH1 family peptidyl-tRNA hydrolase